MRYILSVLRKFYRAGLANKAGFSLLEMSIVLVIMGTLASVMVPMLIKQSVTAKRTLTRQHQQDIFYSLAAYLLVGNPLPCPADPAAKGAQFGVAREGGCSAPIQAIGILPFRTLGLPESVARDGYQRFFTYAVEPTLTQEPDDFNGGTFDDKFRDSYCKIQGPGVATAQNLQVKTAAGDSVLGKETKGFADKNADFIAVVIISHGETGHGAFCADGSNTRFRSQKFGLAEDQNAQDNLVFFDLPYSTNPINFFRHMTAWVTHKNLVAIYGHTPCKIAPKRGEDSSSLPPSGTISTEEEPSLDVEL
ncbi:MAG: prepilin-type N-terminal cleavage/methylation domain-containing protein [Alphaproteobacteria bacterium]|nr:prepilin-type N-terminal cleavage/methylation domain-containing protein [Alphaproteobacteria bacterium]